MGICCAIRFTNAPYCIARSRILAATWAMMCMIVGVAPFLDAQTKQATPAAATHRPEPSPLEMFQLAVRERSALATSEVDRCRDSVAAVIADSSASAKRILTRFGDSIVVAMADSMNVIRRTSLNGLSERVSLGAAAVVGRHIAAVHTIAQQTRQVILTSANVSASCTDCGPGDDFGRRWTVFAAWCDSARDASIEAMTARGDQALDSISQEYETARDSVSEQAESLLEEETDERESRADSSAHEEEIASRLIVTVAYDNPVAYLGRDNGSHFFELSPTLFYRHRWGIFASLSGSWLNEAKNNWDVTTAAVGYGRSIGEEWYGALSYAHLWFSSTSSQSKSVLDNSLDLEVDWSGTFLTATAQLSFAFSKSSEASLVLSATAPLTVFEEAGSGTLIFEPGISGAYGQQDASLVTARKQKSNKGAVPTANVKPRKTIGVLDYEFCVPLSYRRGVYAVSAAYTVVAPLNVLDESTSTLFGVVSIDISMTIR